MSFLTKHKVVETNATLLMVLSLGVVTIGGIVELVPLFYLENTIENVQGVRPYTPLELTGRSIYMREGCYVCHSQMIRPMRDEVERYGHYSLAAESMYDHPFQWGSKRTGPDLARVGGRYSDDWHLGHLYNPRDYVPESIMPAYPWLQDTLIGPEGVDDLMRANAMVGVPYTEDMLANAQADFAAQADPDADTEGLVDRYTWKEDDSGNVVQPFPRNLALRNFDGRPGVSEADALIAYLQVLGTMVDFSTFEPDASR